MVEDFSLEQSMVQDGSCLLAELESCLVNCGPHKYENQNFWMLFTLESYFGFLDRETFFFFGVSYLMPCLGESLSVCADVLKEKLHC